MTNMTLKKSCIYDNQRMMVTVPNGNKNNNCNYEIILSPYDEDCRTNRNDKRFYYHIDFN